MQKCSETVSFRAFFRFECSIFCWVWQGVFWNDCFLPWVKTRAFMCGGMNGHGEEFVGVAVMELTCLAGDGKWISMTKNGANLPCGGRQVDLHFFLSRFFRLRAGRGMKDEQQHLSFPAHALECRRLLSRHLCLDHTPTPYHFIYFRWREKVRGIICESQGAVKIFMVRQKIFTAVSLDFGKLRRTGTATSTLTTYLRRIPRTARDDRICC